MDMTTTAAATPTHPRMVHAGDRIRLADGTTGVVDTYTISCRLGFVRYYFTDGRTSGRVPCTTSARSVMVIR